MDVASRRSGDPIRRVSEIDEPHAALSRSPYGVTPNLARKARSSGWSRRYAPPTPEHVELNPNDVTATTRLEFVSSKVGPPESPKQVPPLWGGPGLFDRSTNVSWGAPGSTPLSELSFTSPFRRVPPPSSVNGPLFV